MTKRVERVRGHRALHWAAVLVGCALGACKGEAGQGGAVRSAAAREGSAVVGIGAGAPGASGAGPAGVLSASGALSSTAAVGAARSGSAAVCTPGVQRRYAFDYQGSSRADFRALLARQGKKVTARDSGAVREVEVRVQGALVVTDVEAVAEGGCVAVASMAGAKVRLSAGALDGAEQMEALQQLLGRETPVVRDGQGRVLGLHLGGDAGPLPRSLWRGFWGLLQVALPPAGAVGLVPGATWKTREQDATGVYEARYEVQGGPAADAGDSAVLVRKVKVGYLPPPPRPGRIDPVQTYRIDGGLELRLDRATGALLGARGGETQEMEISGKTVARGRFTLTVAEAPATTLAAAAVVALRVATRTSMAAPLVPLWQPDGVDAEASIHRTELGDATKESLLSALAQAEKAAAADEKEGAADEQSLYLKLKALVFLQPSACAELGRVLAGATARGLSMRVLAGALGSIGHAQAQEALAVAVRARKGEWPALSQLVPMFIDADAPTPSTEALLRELSRSPEPPIASTAALVLGGVARNLAAREPARADAIVGELLAKGEEAGPIERTALYLQALGNTGAERILPLMERHLVGPTPALRAAAAQGVRRVRLARVDALLLDALAREADPKVRTEVVSATAARPVTDAIVAGWRKALDDRDAEVRQAVLRNLWNAREVVADAPALLRRLAKKDPSAEVRRSAAELLKQQ